MEKFRISNDLSVFWSITEKDGSPYTLSDKTVRLFVTHPRGRIDVTEDITIQGNVICWLFRGSRQRYLGTYKITVEIQASPADRIIRRDIPEAFELVSSSQYEQTVVGRPDINDTGNLTLATSLDIFQIKPIIPQVGPNRNWWVDGADTGKSSVGLTAYEFAKEQGYEGTEAEYAAECLAVATLNEESRIATAASVSATQQSVSQYNYMASYMEDEVIPNSVRANEAAGAAEQATQNANTATAAANAAADRANAEASAVNDAAEAARAATENANSSAERTNAAATEANAATMQSQSQYNQVSSYMSGTVNPAVTKAQAAATRAENAAISAEQARVEAETATGKANTATTNANEAANRANDAAEMASYEANRAEEAIEQFGPAIANKADLENGKIKTSQLPDYLLGQVMYGGLIYDDATIAPSDSFVAKYGMKTIVSAGDASKYSGVYFIVSGYASDNTVVGVSQVSTGDWIISTGLSWQKIDNSDAVTSVAGLVGNVNASALAAVLAELTDANSLARKIDLPKPYDDTDIKNQLTELSAELESNGQLIEDLQNMKIDKEADDYYPQLSVGTADNLAGVDEVASEFTFRRSGGGAITDGVARVQSIKGNSEVIDGEIVNMKVIGIKSVGRNAWDEEWENGAIANATGEDAKDSSRIRSKNYIPIFPSTNYYCYYGEDAGANHIYAFFYDNDKNFISGGARISGKVFTTPSNAYYLRISNYGATLTTYKHDICINLSDSEFNGQYEAYREATEDLSIVAKYFPNGMAKAGSAHDEFRYIKQSNKWNATARIKAIRVKDGAWIRTSVAHVEGVMVFLIKPTDISSATGVSTYTDGVLMARYGMDTTEGTSTMIDKSTRRYATSIYVRDDSYTDVASFLASFSDDDMLYYELAEPIVTEIEEKDFNLDYSVWNCGTETAIAEGKSAPLAADITYGFNAVGLLKQIKAALQAAGLM